VFGFFKKRPQADPPTEKQRRYAAKLGIDVPAMMTKAQLSDAIADAERSNPAIVYVRDWAKFKMREKKYGKALLAEEDRWKRLADQGGFILAIYSRRKDTLVDVLRINEAFLDVRGKLKLGVEAPKVVKDPDIGVHLDWDRHFELPIESLFYSTTRERARRSGFSCVSYRPDRFI
jgi:hypothetical protein